MPNKPTEGPTARGGIACPHFSETFTFNAKGEAVVVEQDSPGDLVARAKNVAVCPIGFREDHPDFGIPETLFQTIPLDTTGVRQAIAKWAELNLSISEHGEALQTAVRQVIMEVSP
jgi:hypothetical protein